MALSASLKRVIIGLVIAFAATLAVIATLRPQTSSLIADTVPAISLAAIDGRSLDLSTLRGRPLLVQFWATTCTVCVHEIPDLVKLYKRFKPTGLELIAIAMAYDPPNRVVELARQRQLPYPVALDLDGTAAHVFGEVKLTPSTFLIDSDGRIVEHYLGALDFLRLRTRLQTLLSSDAV